MDVYTTLQNINNNGKANASNCLHASCHAFSYFVNSDNESDLHNVYTSFDTSCGSSMNKNAVTPNMDYIDSFSPDAKVGRLFMDNNISIDFNYSSSDCSLTFSENLSEIREIANNPPIILEGDKSVVWVMDEYLGVSPNVTEVEPVIDYSQSFTQSDTIIQDQLSTTKDTLLSGRSSLCIHKGATSGEQALGDKQSKVNWVDNGLHSQWGFTFCKGINWNGNVHCQEINSNDMKAWVAEAYELANKFDVPNYRGARVKVISQLNVKQFRHLLSDYKFNVIVDYVEFGFPLSMDYDNFSHIQETRNHKSATMFPQAVQTYINTEKNHNALVGPFSTSPFPKLHVSPLMTRPKPDGSRRLIVDLSWPKGLGVNSRIPDNTFDNYPGVLQYPTVDHIVQAVNRLGSDSLLFKIDLKRAYRNLRSDPRDFSVLGIQWNSQRYVDVSVAFGLKCGASACQLVTDSVTHLLASAGIWTCAYLDDIVGVARPQNAYSAFLSLKNLITSLGLPINEEKVSTPVSKLTCLGIQIDARTGIMSIPQEKLQQIRGLCTLWSTKTTATRKELQKLVGHLMYLHKCIQPARLFVNRVLQALRNAPLQGRTSLSAAFYKDIAWFSKFMASFNGHSKFDGFSLPTVQLHVDACLEGIGAISDKKVYHKLIPQCYKWSLSIVHFEMVNVIVAFRVWGSQWVNTWVEIFCDNAAVVSVLSTGSSKDPFLAACARTLWLLKAQLNIKTTVQFIPGHQNNYADTLSRWHHLHNTDTLVVKFLKRCKWFTVHNDCLQPDFDI